MGLFPPPGRCAAAAPPAGQSPYAKHPGVNLTNSILTGILPEAEIFGSGSNCGDGFTLNLLIAVDYEAFQKAGELLRKG
jgi:hypothetical protein